MGHARAIVLHCMDFRFVSGIRDFLKALGYAEGYDLVAAAGAAKNLVDPYDSTDPEFVLRQIEIAKKLHGITDVILINHLDCGAYGTGTFVDEREEVERHRKDLIRAGEIVRRRFEGLTTLHFLARKRPDGAVDFEKAG